MGLFHCPLGVLYYDCEGCIDCGMCQATTREAMVAASKKVRDYIKAQKCCSDVIRKIALCGKGGVGKSSLVTLLANAFQEEGYSVILIDTDESNPGLFNLCGLQKEPEPLISSLTRINSGISSAETEWLQKDQISLEDIPSQYIVSKDALHFLMVGKIVDPFQGCACTMAEMTRNLVGKLVLNNNEVALIDMEAGVESFGRGVERSVDTVLVVIEPSFQAMALADKINYMAEGMGISRVRAILNKVPSEEIEQKMMVELGNKDINIIGTIGIDNDISAAGFEGRPLGESIARNQLKMITQALLLGT